MKRSGFKQPERRPVKQIEGYTPRPRAIIERGWLREVGAFELTDAPRLATTKTAAEAAYMGRVAALGCVVCRLFGYGPSPAQVHHVRAGVGKAQRAGNYCTLPLCEPHHTGDGGVHGDRACLRQLNLTELDLLDITIGELT